MDRYRDAIEINELLQTISFARFGTFLRLAGGRERLALDLYLSNIRVACSLYPAVNIWEIALRNKLNAFLTHKFSEPWPFDHRAVRSLDGNDRRRLQEVVSRQVRRRGEFNVTTNHVVADLSAGFWVSLLHKKYDVPYAWRKNITALFPHSSEISRTQAASMCEQILNVRNRIAHHEPIIHLPLAEIRQDINALVSAMCGPSARILQMECGFRETWSRHCQVLERAGFAPSRPEKPAMKR